MSQNLRNFTASLYGFDAVVQRVPPDRWSNDSPCEGWCARDVLAHQMGVLNAVTAIARTGDMVGPADVELGDDPVAEWNHVRDDVIAALDRQGVLQQEGQFFFGKPTVDALVGFVAWDPLGHSWDLAQATGQQAHTDQTMAQHVLDTITPMADTLRKYGVMGDPVAVEADADAMTQFLGLTGRDPNR